MKKSVEVHHALSELDDCWLLEVDHMEHDDQKASSQYSRFRKALVCRGIAACSRVGSRRVLAVARAHDDSNANCQWHPGAVLAHLA